MSLLHPIRTAVDKAVDAERAYANTILEHVRAGADAQLTKLRDEAAAERKELAAAVREAVVDARTDLIKSTADPKVKADLSKGLDLVIGVLLSHGL